MMRDIYSAEELQDQLEDSKQEVQDLTCDLTEAQEAYQAISTERDRLADEVQGFRGKLDAQESESKQALVHFNEQKEKAKRIVKAQQIKFKALEVKHEEMKKTGSGADKNGAENPEKDAEIGKLKKELLEKNEEFEAYQTRSKGQIDNLFQQMTELENSSLETEKNKEEMDQKLADLKSHENEINGQLAQALETITTLKSTSLENEWELERKIRELEEQGLETITMLQAINLENDIVIESKISELEEANSNLDSKITELDSIRTELISKQTHLDDKQAEIDSTKTDLKSTQNVLDSTKLLLEQSNAGFEHEISDLKRAISEKVEITEQLKSGNSDEVTTLRNEFESSKKELIAKNEQIDDLKEQVFFESSANGGTQK
jgi:putative ABC transport system permease protein